MMMIAVDGWLCSLGGWYRNMYSRRRRIAVDGRCSLGGCVRRRKRARIMAVGRWLCSLGGLLLLLGLLLWLVWFF